MSQHFVRNPKILAAWSLILLAGMAVGWKGAQSHRAELRSRLIEDTKRSAVAFDALELRGLAGSPADLPTTLYAHVKGRLRALHNVTEHARSVFLLRPQPETGKTILLADSSPAGAPDAPPPGREFPAAESPGLHGVISLGGAATDGPTDDRSGPWVTGYAAIETATASPAAAPGREILGVEIDAAEWGAQLWNVGVQRALLAWIVAGLPLLAWLVRQRQAEQREVIRNFSEAMEQSRSALLIVDLAGRIEYANRGLCQQTGYQRRELLGRSWRDGQMPSPTGEVLTDIFASVRAGRSWEGEWLNRRKDGTVYPARGIVTPVRHRDGSISCFVAVFDDVTESKRREAELRDARDLAQAGDRAKSQFLATMSHEVRTPLNGIVGFTSLLLETPLAAEQREFVQTIRASGESLIQLTGDILDFARIESGKFKLDPVPCDPRECIEDALDLLAAKAAQKKIELVHHIADDVPAAIVADAGRLRQILLNLVGNAVKFTATGEVEVSVRRTAKSGPAVPAPATGSTALPDDCVLEFSVRDTGIGIAPDHHEKLFKPFSQVDDSSTRRYGGTGLGLAICRSLVQMLGGEIACTSTPGQGSTFTFTVRTPIAMLSLPRRDLGNLRIGLAIQPGSLRQELAELATRWGSPVVEADSPAELGAKAWDVALVDTPEPLAMALAEATEPLPGLAPERTFGLVPISLSTELRAKLRTHFRLLINKPIHHESLFAVVSGAIPVAKIAPPSTQFGLHVLVAEDNVVNQRLMQRVLTKLGCTSTLVENGRQAVEKLVLPVAPYDVMLLDMHMPEMDGLTALRAIRAGTAGTQAQKLWIIALTADARQPQRAQALEAGLNDYLTKPLDLAQLEAALRRFCMQRERRPTTS